MDVNCMSDQRYRTAYLTLTFLYFSQHEDVAILKELNKLRLLRKKQKITQIDTSNARNLTRLVMVTDIKQNITQMYEIFKKTDKIT